MAEEVATPVAVDATKAVDEPTRSVEAAEPATAAEEKPSDSGDVPGDAPVEGNLCPMEPFSSVTE